MYAAPWGGLANALVTQAFVDTVANSEVLDQAREAAEQAVRRDSAQGDAHATLAYLRLVGDHDFAAADSAFRDVRQRFPRVVMGAKWHADLLMASGLMDSSLAELRRAYALDPALAITMYNIAGWFVVMRQQDSAEVWMRRSLQAAPRMVISLTASSRLAAALGDSAATLAMLARLKEASTRVAIPIEELARAWGRGGATALARLMGDASRNPRVPSDRALWLAFGGDDEGALRAWDEAIASGDVWALFLPLWPAFDRLRGDPRFRARMERMGMPPSAIERFAMVR
jgi:tetratricopeptide (TPR) repeat protein